MSIRTNSEKAVPLVLKHLDVAKRRALNEANINEKDLNLKLAEFKDRLNEIKGLFGSVKKQQQELLDQLTDLDIRLRRFKVPGIKDNSWSQLFEADMFNRKPKDSHTKDGKTSPGEEVKGPKKHQRQVSWYLEDIFERMKELVKESDSNVGKTSQGEEAESSEKRHRQLSLCYKDGKVDKVLKNFRVSYEKLEPGLRLCLLSLSIFPEKAVIEKRPLIYWWIGEGFIEQTKEKTAEESGESIFDELLYRDLILPYGNGKCPFVKKCQIHPWIRHMLLISILGKKNPIFGYYSKYDTTSRHACLLLDADSVDIDEYLNSEDIRTIFNVDARYLNFKAALLAKLKKMVVLHLGRWQDSSVHHIEVESDEFLNNLKASKHLKYLSLRGISRITKLPASIVEHVTLEILDLKACHNLETLPDNIASLKRLTHLDVSQCYLLEKMPKGLEKLTSLQVLKGFVIGDLNKTPCRIGDLAKLRKLKRLGIHIGSEAVIQDKEFERLRDISSVKRLKVSWGAHSKYLQSQKYTFSFPPSLEKLDLEGFPEESIPSWLKPSELGRGLKRLYIKGGKLKSLEHGERSYFWGVEVLRLRYLSNLRIVHSETSIVKKTKQAMLLVLKNLFPNLKYVQNQGGEEGSLEWSIEDMD